MASHEDEETVAAPPPPAQMAEIFGGPSLFVNKTYLTPYQSVARLTFVEQADGQEAFRASVTMSWPDIVALRDLLNRFAENLVPVTTPKKEPASDG